MSGLRIGLFGLLLSLAQVVAVAQAPCPTCGRLHQLAQLPGQAIAQSRANYMARFGYRGHPPSSAGNFGSVGNFEGVGWSSRRGLAKQLIPTCRPSGPSGAADDRTAALIGDAVAYGAGGSYRVRIWQRGARSVTRTRQPSTRNIQRPQRRRLLRR